MIKKFMLASMHLFSQCVFRKNFSDNLLLFLTIAISEDFPVSATGILNN